jgi:hypothetical protein
MTLRFRWLLAGTLVGALGSANAQELGTNQVYIGQTGDTNTITIDQEGNSNLVGENADILRLNQFGARNTLTVDQFGFSNSLGALLTSPFPEFRVFGPNQEGDRNQLVVDQSNLNSNAANSIGATGQIAATGRSSVGNFMTVTQVSGEAGLGQAIEQIVQINFTAGLANSVDISQTDENGIGGNIIGRIWQNGSDNGVVIDQINGENEVRTVTQWGAGNRLTVDQDGARNLVDIVEQNNDVQGGGGNIAELRFESDANGSDGANGFSNFASGLPTVRAPGQAQVFQLGSENTLSFLATGGSNNLYGFTQDGDGNGVRAISDGNANEIAIAQFGDGNSLSSVQDGDRNRGAILQFGDYNVVDLTQTGNGNLARVVIEGSFNNAPRGSFAEPLLAASSAPGIGRLGPGVLRQVGADNSIELDVIGDNHLFAVLSEGARNQVVGFMQGSGNQALIVQTGDDNIANFSQVGSGNAVLILQ